MVKPNVDELMQAIEDGGLGFCLSCGAEASCVEPDARNYKCEECGEYQVFGAEELLMMGAYSGEV